MKSFLLLVFFLCICMQSYAQGGLLITPKRVVFEGNKQVAEISLMNTGSDSAAYSVSFRNYNMTELGKLELIEKPDSNQLYADPYLRVFPRKVTLAPGEGQSIIVQCRRKTNMKAGEYRSHLWFRDEKNYEPLGKAKEQLLDSNQLSISVTAIYGMTIPVIIRSGEVNVGASLSGLKLGDQKDSLQFLNVTVNRIGNISISGKLIVEYVPDQGKPYQVGSANAVIYTNLNKREISIRLTKMPDRSLIKGKLKVQFVSNDESKKPIIYALTELELK